MPVCSPRSITDELPLQIRPLLHGTEIRGGSRHARDSIVNQGYHLFEVGQIIVRVGKGRYVQRSNRVSQPAITRGIFAVENSTLIG